MNDKEARRGLGSNRSSRRELLVAGLAGAAGATLATRISNWNTKENTTQEQDEIFSDRPRYTTTVDINEKKLDFTLGSEQEFSDKDAEELLIIREFLEANVDSRVRRINLERFYGLEHKDRKPHQYTSLFDDEFLRSHATLDSKIKADRIEGNVFILQPYDIQKPRKIYNSLDEVPKDEWFYLFSLIAVPRGGLNHPESLIGIGERLPQGNFVGVRSRLYRIAIQTPEDFSESTVLASKHLLRIDSSDTGSEESVFLDRVSGIAGNSVRVVALDRVGGEIRYNDVSIPELQIPAA